MLPCLMRRTSTRTHLPRAACMPPPFLTWFCVPTGYYEAMLEILRVSEQKGGLPVISSRLASVGVTPLPDAEEGGRASKRAAVWSGGAASQAETGAGQATEVKGVLPLKKVRTADARESGEVVALKVAGPGVSSPPRLNVPLARTRLFRKGSSSMSAGEGEEGGAASAGNVSRSKLQPPAEERRR